MRVEENSSFDTTREDAHRRHETLSSAGDVDNGGDVDNNDGDNDDDDDDDDSAATGPGRVFPKDS